MDDATQAEHWLPIPGFGGDYEVSDLGRVRSMGRFESVTEDYGRRRQGRVLKASKNGAGYLHVSLPSAAARSGYRVRTVHSLVLLTFVGSRPEGMQGRHLNGDRTDCRLSNLAYGTPAENEADKKKHGMHEKGRRTHCPLNHQLAPPNLVLGALKQGRRNCMACSRARSTLQNAARSGVTLDLEVEAERHYRNIMRG